MSENMEQEQASTECLNSPWAADKSSNSDAFYRSNNTSNDVVIDKPSPSSPASPPLLKIWTDKALDFLAHANNETLGACLVGLGATTYFVLGRVGLVIIGVAGGVVLHATWEGVRNDDGDEETKRREGERRRQVGVDIATRVLEWRSNRGDAPVLDNEKVQELDFFTRFEPETAQALNAFADAMIKDYVYYWYGPTLPGEDSFPLACKRTFTTFTLSLSDHLRRKRPADAFLDWTTNSSSIIIVLLNELAAATNACPNQDARTAIQTYLQLKPDTSLSYVLDERAQKAKLGTIAQDILQTYLEPKVYSCPPVQKFLKEVLAQLVLGSTVTMCSRPEWINEWIVYGLEESATTQNVMDIVDAGVEGRTSSREVKSEDPVEQASKPQESYHELPKSTPLKQPSNHRRQSSKAEEAMDEAMREAKRLTQLMIEEDEKRAREEHDKQPASKSWDDLSEITTQGAPTPTSSQSDRDRQDQETSTWATDSSTVAPSRSESMDSTTSSQKQQFLSFDQLGPSQPPTALSDTPDLARRESHLTLHNANISIFDDSMPGEKDVDEGETHHRLSDTDRAHLIRVSRLDDRPQVCRF